MFLYKPFRVPKQFVLDCFDLMIVVRLEKGAVRALESGGRINGLIGFEESPIVNYPFYFIVLDKDTSQSHCPARTHLSVEHLTWNQRLIIII